MLSSYTGKTEEELQGLDLNKMDEILKMKLAKKTELRT